MKYNVNNADLSMTLGVTSKFPRDPRPEIALSGRSNVGKSSLINTLLNRKSLARTSSAPGKTITINYYGIDDKFFLVDLPGYGFAKRSKDSQMGWSSLTENYFLKNPSSDAVKLVLQLVDIRTGPTEDDVMMMNFLLERGIPFAVVATKTDKLSKTALGQAIDSLKNDCLGGTDIPVIPFSSVTREGKELVWSQINAVLQ